jgi:hypothetical protein
MTIAMKTAFRLKTTKMKKKRMKDHEDVKAGPPTAGTKYQDYPATYMEPSNQQEESGELAIKEESYKGPETEKLVAKTDKGNKL